MKEKRCVDCAFRIEKKDNIENYCPMKQEHIKKGIYEIHNCKYFGRKTRKD